MEEKFILTRKMSTGNDTVGTAWDETKIFDGETTLSEAMDWALNSDRGLDYKEEYSRRKVIITKPHQ